jgi:uncharacterized repeat protein (TIGR02543 family)
MPSMKLIRIRLGALLAVLFVFSALVNPSKALATTDLIDLTFQIPARGTPLAMVLPIDGTYTGLTVDWGDGFAAESFNSGVPVRHYYPTAGGTFHVRVESVASGSITNFGALNGWRESGGRYLTAVTAWSGITSFSGAFWNSAVTTVPATLPAGVTDTSHMFDNAPNFNTDISGWDMSQVTTATWMFGGTNNFNADLQSWDVRSLQDASFMFESATAFSGDLSGWQTPSLTNMHNVLDGAPVDFSLGGWDVSHVIDLSGALSGTNLSAENYSATLVGWATQSVQPNLTLNSLRPYVSDAQTQAARSALQATPAPGWTITGDIPYYTLAYDLAGGAGTIVTPSAVAAGSPINIPDDSGVTRSGYTLTGWTDQTSVYQSGDTVPVNNAGITLTAQWQQNAVVPPAPPAPPAPPVVPPAAPSPPVIAPVPPAPPVVVTIDPVVISLDPVGGTTDVRTHIDIMPGTTYELPSTTQISKPGYTFEGWTDGNKFYPAGAKFTVGWQPVAFTAQWKKIKLPQVIPSPKLRAVFYPGMSLTLPHKTDVGLAIAYSNADGTNASCSTTPDGLVRILDANDCNIIANQQGNDDYLAAATVTIPVKIDPTPSKVRKILFRFVGKHAVLSSGSMKQVKTYVDYVNALLADPALALRINVRSYYKVDGSVTPISKQRRGAMRQALIDAGLPLAAGNPNLEVHLYFSPGYHARYSWASVPEVRVVG